MGGLGDDVGGGDEVVGVEEGVEDGGRGDEVGGFEVDFGGVIDFEGRPGLVPPFVGVSAWLPSQ